MKKLFCLFAVVIGFAFASQAASTNVLLAAGAYTNVLVGASTVTQFALSPAVVGSSASVKVIDAPQSTNQFYVLPAYITKSTYATNYITNWVNYFGVTNSWTNIVVIDYTNTVSSVTNAYPVRLAASTVTNGTTILDGVNYYFNMGINITNTGAGAANISVTYQQ